MRLGYIDTNCVVGERTEKFPKLSSYELRSFCHYTRCHHPVFHNITAMISKIRPVEPENVNESIGCLNHGLEFSNAECRLYIE